MPTKEQPQGRKIPVMFDPETGEQLSAEAAARMLRDAAAIVAGAVIDGRKPVVPGPVLREGLAAVLDMLDPRDVLDMTAKGMVDDHGETAAIAAKTLTGDIRDAMLARIRDLKKPWAQMTEAEQRDVVYGVSNAAATMVRIAVEMIALDRRDATACILADCQVKSDKIVLKLTLPREAEERHALMDAVGQVAYIAVGDVAKYTGEQAPPKVDPDQRNIPGTEE